MARITAHYIPGNGDSGYSELMKGHRLRKSHPAAEVHGRIEHLRNQIEFLLAEEEIFQTDLKYLFHYLLDHLFSVSSFCWCIGETTNHLFPIELLQFLNKRTGDLKEELGNSQSFRSQKHRKLILLDGIRIEIRTLERSYDAWRDCNEVKDHLLKNHYILPSIEFYAAILNRLSAYLFEATRMEEQLMFKQGLLEAVEQSTVWTEKIENFSPPEEAVQLDLFEAA